MDGLWRRQPNTMRHRQYSERHGRVAGVLRAYTTPPRRLIVTWGGGWHRTAIKHTPERTRRARTAAGCRPCFVGVFARRDNIWVGWGGWRRDYDRIATRASCVRACVCLDTHSDGATKPRAAAAAAVDAPAGGRRNCVWEWELSDNVSNVRNVFWIRSGYLGAHVCLRCVVSVL